MNERCKGSFQPAKNVRSLNDLGPRFFGKFLGECAHCGRNVKVSKGKATAHKTK